MIGNSWPERWLVIEMGSVPAPDEAAHLDGLLMHELSVVNARLGRYVVRFLDADAGRAEHVTTAEELDLAERIEQAAAGIRTRATRREQHKSREAV